ncbi:MAG TPA: polyphenol oxidase family protein [Candidatus Peribacterales bacterium]|nr:polyphenol oxidase family protein [Candidatus Peribacterales bacterium]
MKNDIVRRGAPLARPDGNNVFIGRPGGAPLHTSIPFILFQQFPELRVGLFGKDSSCSSDEECAAHLGFKKVSKLNQVHGNIIHVAENTKGIPDGDGLITAQTGLALSVRWADCQAFAVYAPEKKVIGVLHAGWKGMAVKAITSLYESLDESFGVKPEETFVGIAPSLCKQCADFTDPFNELPEHLHPFIDGKNVDLQAAADHELDSLGVPQNQRERHPACTRCGEGFWSWRRKENARNYLVVSLV